MNALYYIDVPARTPGGYEGRHYFFTRREAEQFIVQALERGVVISATIEKTDVSLDGEE